MENIQNSFLYYFSTIAQVSAAFIGLLAVFIVFFFQLIDSKMKVWIKQYYSETKKILILLKEYELLKDLKVASKCNDIPELANFSQKFKTLKDLNSPEWISYLNESKPTAERIKIYNNDKTYLLNKFWFSLSAGSISITISCISIPFLTLLVNCFCFLIFISIMDFVLFVLCGLYGFKMIKRIGKAQYA